MAPEMIEAIKAYLKENLSISIETGEDWESFSSGNFYRVKVKISLDGDVIAEDSDSFKVEGN